MKRRLALQHFLDDVRRHHPVVDRGQGDGELAGQLANDQVKGRDIAAVAVERKNAAKTVPRQGANDAAQESREGVKIERNGAAKGHVVLGQAAPHRRRHHHRRAVGDLARRALGDLAGQPGVGLHRHVGAVLFGGTDRHDDDGVLFGQRPQFMGLEVGPFDVGHDDRLRFVIGSCRSCRIRHPRGKGKRHGGDAML